MPLSVDYFDPSRCGIPRPRVPLLPKLALREFAIGNADSCPSGFLRRRFRFFTRGRYALHSAMRSAGVGSRGGLLAPAYHCRTMIDPAVALAAEVLLYPVQADLSPDPDGLRQLADTARAPVRAMLLTHYFGFPQRVDAAVEFCKARGITLIEDCSHAFFGDTGFGPVGTIGDYAVASPYKFFPCTDGGILVANGSARLPDAPPGRYGYIAEFRSLARDVRAAIERDRQRVTDRDVETIEGEIGRLLAAPSHPAEMTTQVETTPSTLYALGEQDHAGHAVSRIALSLANQRFVGERRRENYKRWVAGVAGLPGCSAFNPDLPARCVPYMFPLLIADPSFSFILLKRLGVPIWRWDEMAVSPCPTAARYRLHLLHFPCHQDLCTVQMEWMIAAVAKVMTHPARGAI